MVEISGLYNDLKTLCKQWFYDKTESDNKYIAKGNIQGGVNLLGQWQGDKKSGGNCSMPTRTYSVFHENPIDVIDNQSVSDTSDYSGMKYMTKASVFQPTDVFTFSFWAKGDANNTNNEIRTYFYNGMNVRRLYSNSDVDYRESASSSNDGATRFNLTNEWQLFTVTYQIKEGGTNQSSKYPLIRVYGGCKCSVSSAKLERGFNATDYSPCDEIPINLNYNIDYNDYKNDGNYFVWTSQQTGNTNKPPNDTQGGLLTVKSIPNGCIQILYNYYIASPKVYYRIFHSTTGWRDWQTITVNVEPSTSKGVPDDPYNGQVGTSTKYAREDHAHGKLYHWSTGGVTSATYVDLLEFTMTQSWQDRPITFAVTRRAKDRHYYVSIRFSNTDITSSTYTVQSFKVWGDGSAQTFYLRKVEDNKYRLCAYKTANDSYILYDMVCLTEGITVTKIPSADGNYGTTAPSGSAPNLYTSTQIGVPDTDVTWNGIATINSVSPILMGVGEDFNANRLAYFPSERISIQYSTDGGSTWSNYSSIGTENKQRLCMNGYTAYLGNNSTTDRTKNRLRITFDVGDLNTNSVLYMITRKIAVYTGTNNATDFTCQLQTQTYAQYNSNVETFSNYGSSFTLGGNSGWNSYPINITLGGNSGTQTNSSSTRIKALRMVFTQTGGTGNGLVSRIRLYGETAYRTPSNYSNNGHIYYADVNQNAKFPNKIIKEGGTSNEKLLANGDVQNASQISYGTVNGSSTSTVFTATVDGVKELVDGTTVMLKNGVVTSAEGFTLNVNGLGAKPVYSNLASATRDTTIFNINYTMLFVYDSTRVSGGCWVCYRGYDSNTNTIGYQVRTNSTKYKASDKGYAYRIWLQTADDGKFMPVNTSSATNGTTNLSSSMNTRKFLLGGDIRYYSTNATTNANADLTANTMWQQYTFALGYSFNNTSSALSLTVSKPVYMVCTDEGKGLGKLASPYYTQTLPSSADGKLYVLLGYMYSATNLEMTLEHPIFEYKNGSIGLWSSNNHTHSQAELLGVPNTYEIIPSTYKPNINDTYTVTVKVTDCLGNPVQGETVSLLEDGYYMVDFMGIHYQSKTTDNNGEATWTIYSGSSCSQAHKKIWGAIDYNVKDTNVHCQVFVDGWYTASGDETNGSYAVQRNGTHGRLILNGWSASKQTNWYTFGNGSYADDFLPRNTVVGNTGDDKIQFRIDGQYSTQDKIKFRNTNTGAVTVYGQIDWSIASSLVNDPLTQTWYRDNDLKP